jgi:hypothetical protein
MQRPDRLIVEKAERAREKTQTVAGTFCRRPTPA